MTISRRALLGLAFGGLFARMIQPTSAGRFVDGSGLAKGQFVWQPGLAPEGPVTIVVTVRQQIAHVYRAGTLIGIAPLKSVLPAARRMAGVFTLADQRRERRDAHDARLVWLADSVYVEHAGAARQLLALLPDEFAGLLFKATDAGAVVVVAEERGEMARVVTPAMPLLAAASARAAADLLQRAGRPTETAEPMGHEAALVVSLHDREARLMRAGAVEASAPIEIAGDRRAGSFTFTLVGGEGDALSWLAVPIARSADAGQFDVDPTKVLAGLSFADDEAGAAMIHELGRGAVLHVTDRPLPAARKLPSGFELMANRAPAQPAAVAEARPPVRHAKARQGHVVRTVEVPEKTNDSDLARQMFLGPR